VGFDHQDDAGVYRLTDEMALVTTADFITPPVDDPYRFGQIAAANAISDIYAMGGRPITCLNLAAFPMKKLGPEVLHGIVAGALSKITESGAVLAGGHTIEDEEPKFGLAVNGLVHPERIWTNRGARPGDRLLLTKPIGTGVLFNAHLKGWVSSAAIEACWDMAATLSRSAAEVMAGFEIHAATDVTGFGLGGHAFEMARASGVCIEIDMARVPLLDEALDMYRRGMTTGANGANREMLEGGVRFDGEFPEWHRQIVYDPQTSGGLLAALPEHQAGHLLAALHGAGLATARLIGRATPPAGPHRLIFR
jgi:selenide,water dikinase